MQHIKLYKLSYGISQYYESLLTMKNSLQSKRTTYSVIFLMLFGLAWPG